MIVRPQMTTRSMHGLRTARGKMDGPAEDAVRVIGGEAVAVAAAGAHGGAQCPAEIDAAQAAARAAAGRAMNARGESEAAEAGAGRRGVETAAEAAPSGAAAVAPKPAVRLRVGDHTRPGLANAAASRRPLPLRSHRSRRG
jgi:hypothetical protein